MSGLHQKNRNDKSAYSNEKRTDIIAVKAWRIIYINIKYLKRSISWRIKGQKQEQNEERL
jgi:hypothetical protein